MSGSVSPVAETVHPGPFYRRYFGRRPILPWQLPSIMRRHIYTGAMGNVWAYLIAGLFFIHFGNTIGLTPFHWGLMSGLASVLLASQLWAALLTQRLGRRKLLWFVTAVAERSLRLAGILAAWYLWHVGWPHAGVVLIVFVCLANFFGAMAVPPWMSWLADLIPERDHGGFWGRRSAWVALAVVSITVPAGLLLDVVPEPLKMRVSLIIFVAATVIGILDILIHGTIPEPQMIVPPRRHFLIHLLAPVRDVSFRRWLLFNECWNFSAWLGGGLATLYFLEGLGIKRNFLGGMIVLTAVPLVGSLVTATWSGRAVDRVGIKPVLFWGLLFWSILPAFWLVAKPGTSALIWLGISSLVAGVASSAVMTAANKLVTRFPPPPERAMYVAVDSCLASLAGGLGVLSAGIVWRIIGETTWTVAGYTLDSFHILFIISLVLRLASVLCLVPRIHTPDRPPLVAVVGGREEAAGQ